MIRRLPAGVEYTHVKQIIVDLSGPLDVLPWFTSPEHDPLGWSRLRRKTFRALDRVLCREEQRLLRTPLQEHAREHELVAMLRGQFVQHFRLALQLCGVPGKTRWVSTSFVSPSSGAPSEPAPKGLRDRSLGKYPRQLLRDISEILHIEVPHLAAGLTESQVQAAVQRYLKEAPSDRPMGFDMFGVRLDTETA